MSKQKGQAIIEFAFVLPFLMLILIGLFYFAMLFTDLIMLNNNVRNAAREASQVSSNQYASIKEEYEDDSGDKALPFKFYKIDSVKILDKSPNVEVQFQYHLDEGTWLGGILSRFAEKDDSFKDTTEKTTKSYTMFKEYKSGSSSN